MRVTGVGVQSECVFMVAELRLGEFAHRPLHRVWLDAYRHG